MDNDYFDFEQPIIELEKRIEELSKFTSGKKIDIQEEIKRLETKIKRLKKEIYTNLTPWQRVKIARHPKRPGIMDYISRIFTNFIELHGDRTFSDDRAIVAGLAEFDSNSVVIIGHQKGKDAKENIACNFGMPHPEGYRKALRVMNLAEKFGKPILTFIDTPGAYPGIAAEERGQGEAIARNLLRLSRLKVPIIAILIGEGGSGGALAIGVGDKIIMLENAIYSVISPEGCAAILWKSNEKVEESANNLSLTAKDLLELEIIDDIIPEPLGGAHRDYDGMAQRLKKGIQTHLEEIRNVPIDELISNRYKKYRRMGRYIEE
ncbi:MAG: acetyl-CoA carboxylase carboxyltransferase subunit alpha [bacterium]|nr:acetyl-CoA carboxylase carboxyltransferase subunit alpha [bacterium]